MGVLGVGGWEVFGMCGGFAVGWEFYVGGKVGGGGEVA
jgi:hypothetical protein